MSGLINAKYMTSNGKKPCDLHVLYKKYFSAVTFDYLFRFVCLYLCPCDIIWQCLWLCFRRVVCSGSSSWLPSCPPSWWMPSPSGVTTGHSTMTRRKRATGGRLPADHRPAATAGGNPRCHETTITISIQCRRHPWTTWRDPGQSALGGLTDPVLFRHGRISGIPLNGFACSSAYWCAASGRGGWTSPSILNTAPVNAKSGAGCSLKAPVSILKNNPIIT